MITSYTIQYCKKITPGEISEIKSSLVNNITFSSLSTRIGLHRFILAKSLEMTEAIDRFYNIQQKKNHTIWQEVNFFLQILSKLIKFNDYNKILFYYFNT